MIKSSLFLVRRATKALSIASPLTAIAAAAPAHAAMPLPLHGAEPELLAAVMVSLAALGMAVILQRRARATEERNRALESRLQAEREAHTEVENALAGSHEVLCRLVRQQESVRELERCRIARDLHDELGHRLLSLRAELALLQAAVRGTSHGVHDKLSTVVENLDATIRTVRAIVAGLRPIAQGVTLRQAAERHLADFARLHGVDYRFDAGLDEETGRDRDIDGVLFRVLQESLSNVAHHAQATMVCVTLAESAREVTLKVEDDGIGLPPQAGRGSGLEGMRERVEAFGGTLRISAGRRAGTVLCVSLPTHRETTPT
jgi:signal transduction histidine kinase